MISDPVTLTGATGNNEGSASAKTDWESDARTAEPQDNGPRIPYSEEKSHLLIAEDVDADSGPGVTHLFLRVTLPPAPDHKQLRPEEQDRPGRMRN
eukprot:3659194-Pyramimonas_sp.AAC.1